MERAPCNSPSTCRTTIRIGESHNGSESRSNFHRCLFRLFQQEHMARVISVSDDLAMLNESDSNQFQRMGILAAFDSWERAKTFVDFWRRDKSACFLSTSFSSFDELLTPFAVDHSHGRMSMIDTRRLRAAYGRQTSLDNCSARLQNHQVETNNFLSTDDDRPPLSNRMKKRRIWFTCSSKTTRISNTNWNWKMFSSNIFIRK